MPLADRMLADMARRLEIVWRREFPIEGRARDFYRRFYAHMRLDGKRKEKSCGKGPYLLVVVRDSNPEYVKAPSGIAVNRTMWDLKSRYREWARRGYRVHGTLTREEFARDIEVLTGHSAAEWALGVPDGAIGPCLPPLASLPPACAMVGLPPPPPLMLPAMALMIAPALKPAATAPSVPAAIKIGVPLLSDAMTQAQGSPRRARTISHKLRSAAGVKLSWRLMNTR